jgi:hypothetical protein
MLTETFGEKALSQAITSEWFKRFKDGRKSVEDDEHSGRPSTCTQLQKLLQMCLTFWHPSFTFKF